MNAMELKNRVEQLIADYANDATLGFLETINLKYKQKLLATLNQCINASSEDDTKLAEELKNCLANNWQQVKRYGISYTAQPRDPITLLLCDVADFVYLQLAPSIKGPTLFPINYLMPDIVTQRVDMDDDEAANVLTKQNLRTVLSTFIQGSSDNYLIPVQLLATYIHQDNTARYNPYFDFETMADSSALISEQDFMRLTQHSADTLALFAAWQHLIAAQEESPCLLAKLERLNRHLHANSKNGMGREDNAAGAAYQPIIDFFNYYNKLSTTLKSQIPVPVKEQIDLLYNLVTDQTVNVNATQNLETCIATRRNALSNAIQPHRQVLDAITIDENTQKDTLAAAQKAFEDQKKRLLDSIEQDKYDTGADPLGYSSALLKTLEITPRIKSIADLKTFMQLATEDIKELLTDANIAQQVSSQLNSIEALVAFLHDTQTGKKEPLITACSHLIKSCSELSALLSSFEEEEVLIEILTGLKVKIAGLMNIAANFSITIMFLSMEQRTLVFNQLRPLLIPLIRSAEEFSLVMEYLPPASRVSLFEQLSGQLLDHINDARTFSLIIKHLSPEQQLIVYNQVSNTLPEWINSTADFFVVMQYLPEEQRQAMYGMYAAKFKDWINSIGSLGSVLQFLSVDHFNEVLTAHKDKLSDLLCSADAIKSLLGLLPVDKRDLLYDHVKDILPLVIVSTESFSDAMKYFGVAKRALIFDSQIALLPKLIRTSKGLRDTLKVLSLEQTTIVLRAIKAKLPRLLSCGVLFAQISEELSAERIKGISSGRS